MTARMVLVTGGCRSGKSAFAQRLAEKAGEKRVYLATCPILDGEMADRVARHREERRGKGWETVEEEIDLARAVRAIDPAAVVVVDCLTLWVNNLLYRCEWDGQLPDEDKFGGQAREFSRACSDRTGIIIVVTNEVGWGIVPENAIARRFRDLAGRVNQIVTADADEAHLLVCGQSIRIK